MTNPSSPLGDRLRDTADRVSDTVAAAYAQGSETLAQASDGVTRFRSTMRAQPVTMAFVMLALGYMIGTQIRR